MALLVFFSTNWHACVRVCVCARTSTFHFLLLTPSLCSHFGWLLPAVLFCRYRFIDGIQEPIDDKRRPEYLANYGPVLPILLEVFHRKLKFPEDSTPLDRDEMKEFKLCISFAVLINVPS